MTDYPRLIEHAFPLKQASLDSVHEKNVRHGHISTLHIWPARRPLAACRAALIATLLPDPSAQPKPEGMSDEEWQKEIIRQRQELCEKIGGKVVKKIERKKMPNGQVVEREKEITEGGILHWKRETENKKTLDWFREEIRKVHGGRAPKVLDPFAGGGAIPLEAMRLGCEATAVDINPVAWFILKCTLEYPQKLAGKTFPLPDFILENEDFMNAFYKANPHLVGRTKLTKKQLEDLPLLLKETDQNNRAPRADLAWHVRAWGQWVLANARRDLAKYYPTYADFEPLDLKNPKSFEPQPMKLVPLKEDGNPDIDKLNSEFSKEYLRDKRNPRWVAKPTVAYLWARTVTCKNCRATVPLLKTRWLCKKDRKRILLTMEPNAERTGVVFGIQKDVPTKGGNAAQNREHDKKISAGTMSLVGAKCPCCGVIMTKKDDIRIEGNTGGIGNYLTAVVIDGQNGKEYRLPAKLETSITDDIKSDLEKVYDEIPLGLPNETITEDGKGSTWCVRFGFKKFEAIFTQRQLLSFGILIKWCRLIDAQPITTEIKCYLSCVIGKMLDYGNTNTSWYAQNEQISHLFKRFGLPLLWDYSETSPIGGASGSWDSMMSSVSKSIDTAISMPSDMHSPILFRQSSKKLACNEYDLILTDPPYYDSISYAAVMDFFYVWHRRNLLNTDPIIDEGFETELCPKWNHEKEDGELIDDSKRFDDSKTKSKQAYEDGMTGVFTECGKVLSQNGKLVIVFANKQPNAWETLVAATIKSGFITVGSWPVQTEMSNRTRAHGSSALASSVWLVCKKRPSDARVGWDNQVLEEMRLNIKLQLREFWDAGIRGPDFVWAATGPAMEAYSKHPIVKKANEPGQILTVSEFLNHVRRIVVDFVVGRVLTGDGSSDAEEAAVDKLDEPTAYYLLHRNDFGMDEAPAGACILYAISCGISDKDLASTWNLISFTKGKAEEEENGNKKSDADAGLDADEDTGSGSKVKLRTWLQRKGKSLGFDAPGGRPVPLIDRIHCLMHLWRAGDLTKVDDYIDANGLRRQELFKQLLQSLIELSPTKSEERSLMESLSNHLGVRGALRDKRQTSLELDNTDNREI